MNLQNRIQVKVAFYEEGGVRLPIPPTPSKASKRPGIWLNLTRAIQDLLRWYEVQQEWLHCAWEKAAASLL